MGYTDHVTFETAEILEEMGIRIFTDQIYFVKDTEYRKRGESVNVDDMPSDSRTRLASMSHAIWGPSHEQVMNYLLDKHRMHIMINCVGSKNWVPTIQQIDGKFADIVVEGTPHHFYNGFDTRPLATEGAIQKCLEKIKEMDKKQTK